MEFDVVPDQLKKAVDTPGTEWTAAMIEETRQWILRDENKARMLSYTRSNDGTIDLEAWNTFIEPSRWTGLVKDKYPPPYKDDPAAFSKWADHEFVAQWLASQQGGLVKIAMKEGFATQPEDALQAFLQERLLDVIERWEPDHATKKSFRNYFIFCFVRDCRRQVRIEAGRIRYQSISARSDTGDCPDLEVEDPGLDPHEQVKWGEYCKILNRCRKKLDPDDSFVIDLRYFDGLPYSEIAKVFDMDGTKTEVCTRLRVRCHRAVGRLRGFMDEEAPHLVEEGVL